MHKVNGVDSIQWKYMPLQSKEYRKICVYWKMIVCGPCKPKVQLNAFMWTWNFVYTSYKYWKSSPKANITIGIMWPQIAKVKLWWKWLHPYNRSFNTVSEIVIVGLIRFFPISASHNVWLAITNKCHKCYSSISTPNVRISMNLNTIPIIKLPC